MDPFIFSRALPQDIPEAIQLMDLVASQLEHKEFFAVNGEDGEWFLRELDRGGYGVCVRNPEQELVGFCFIYVPGDHPDNLGIDLKLPEREHSLVCHAEFAFVRPDSRGHGLEYRMLRMARSMEESRRFSCMAATVHPDNTASVKSLQKAGFHIVDTRPKYGGLLRHIMVCSPAFMPEIL